MKPTEFRREHIQEVVGGWVEARRPEPAMRGDLDVGFRIENRSVVLFEIRPDWRDRSIIRESAFAKAAFVKSSGAWKFFGCAKTSAGKLTRGLPSTRNLEECIAEIDADPQGCCRG